MASELDHPSVCEVVGVFHTSQDLEAAVDELLSSGFDRAELSLLASQETFSGKLGHQFPPAAEIADNPSAPRTAFVSTEAIGDAEGGLIGGLAYCGATAAVGAVIIFGGTITAAIGAAILAGGMGGLIGSALARWVGHHHAAYLRDQIENGGILLWVRAWNELDEARAVDIIARHAADNVHARGLCAAT